MFRLKALAIMGLMLTSACEAETLRYVGLPFSRTMAGEGHVEAVFVFSASIVPGEMLGPSHLRSWTVSAAGREFNDRILGQADTDQLPFFDAAFLVGGDDLPDEWAFGVELQLEGREDLPETIASFRTRGTDFGQGIATFGDSDAVIIDDIVPRKMGAAASDELIFSRASDPGTWTLIPDGDVDADGDVDFADFLVLSANYSKPGDRFDGDFDGDGVVGFPDFLVLSAAYGTGVTVAAVPEPAGLFVILAGLAGAVRRRRKIVRQSRVPTVHALHVSSGEISSMVHPWSVQRIGMRVLQIDSIPHWSLCVCQGLHLFLQRCARTIAFDFQIVMRLKIQPKPFGRVEVSGESQCSIGSDRARTFCDFIDTTCWHINVLGKTILT